VSGALVIRNRQRTRAVNTRLLRRIIGQLLSAEMDRANFDLAVHLVDDPFITRMNEAYLRHQGSTDVITFDYGDPSFAGWLGGEIFVCMPEALRQATRFQTTWAGELVRYIVHGVLHLSGYDDTTAAARRRMKTEENRLLRRLTATFDLGQLSRPIATLRRLR
jgi:probable rRNA maturation factor